MRILMLGNSFIFTNDMPQMLAERTGAEVVSHTRGGARLSEQLNPNTKLGAQTQAALAHEHWDYVVLQEMSHGPLTSPKSFFSSVEKLSKQIRENGAVPVLYATWSYQKGGDKLAAKGWDYDEMARKLSEAYRKAAQDNHALLAAVGERFYELSETQDLYADDGIHPNEQGSRVAADTLAAVIKQHEAARLA
ncbi:MAG: SGNH/GDSL hydrolase family protein [Butyricicoccus sp.]|nr:SGNH/GDSL hydrolase family protein [Butyricicoccus sp.]